MEFSKDIRRRVLSKDDIRFKVKIRTINYEKTLKIIKGIIIINKYIKDFFIYSERRIKIIEFTMILNEPKLALREESIKNTNSNKRDKV